VYISVFQALIVSGNYRALVNNGKRIVLCCISSHVSIPANERAEPSSITSMKLSVTELLHHVAIAYFRPKKGTTVLLVLLCM